MTQIRLYLDEDTSDNHNCHYNRKRSLYKVSDRSNGWQRMVN
ncbi:hypothetical protein [Okeania sp. SIO2B3]|nr:hypothetical protein [Okeania sp. SIO2B3]